MSRLRIIIVEDQWMIRDGLTALAEIADDIEVVATGANGHEAIALADEHRPDVVLMDIKMPRLDGIEATRRILRAHPDIRVLVLTTFNDDDLIQRALAAGAIGYLTKDIAATDLAAAISTAAKGIVQLTPEVTGSLIGEATATPGTAAKQAHHATALADLTPREVDVLRLLTTGASNPQIGVELHLSAGTVKNHVSSILRQLGVTDRTQAAIIATQHNLR